jgi:hypothetical protein
MTSDGIRARRARRTVDQAGDPRRLTAANINPRTGLSTDYLNLFGEAIMLLDLASQAPEYRTELTRWRPLSYRDYFAASQLAHRHLSIAAYQAADGPARRRFDSLCTTMSATIMAVRARLGNDSEPGAAPAAVARLKLLFAQASAVVNGLDGAEGARNGLRAAIRAAEAADAAP